MRMLIAISLAIALPPIPATQANTQVASSSLQRLKSEMRRLAQATDGTVGIAARRLEGGPTISLNGDTTFPMASTFKVAVAATVLDQVRAGTLTLAAMIPVNPKMVVESEGIWEQLPHAGITLSVANLLELMLVRSDNTATDTLVTLVGGPSRVDAWLKRQGIRRQRVDSTIGHAILRDLDIVPGPGTYDENRQRGYAANPAARTRYEKSIPNPAFDADPRDSSTPDAMLLLLSKIADGSALGSAHSDLLLSIMARCVTGPKRLRGLLPEGTPIAHKTGSLFGIVNDVGIITLPNGRGRLAIAVFVKGDTRGKDVRERVIAEIARATYDYFLFE